MSVNFDPKWTENIIYPDRYKQYKCPTCGEIPNMDHINEVIDCMYSNTYYTVRHIPEKLIFTCDNEDCKNCDEDFEIKLKMTIELV